MFIFDNWFFYGFLIIIDFLLKYIRYFGFYLFIFEKNIKFSKLIIDSYFRVNCLFN